MTEDRAVSLNAVINGIKEYLHDDYYQRTSIQDIRDDLIEDVITKLPPVTPQVLSVCDMCIYGNPSSSDGKPCTMCPAITKVGDDDGR